jgi:hypothetical protein
VESQIEAINLAEYVLERLRGRHPPPPPRLVGERLAALDEMLAHPDSRAALYRFIAAGMDRYRGLSDGERRAMDEADREWRRRRWTATATATGGGGRRDGGGKDGEASTFHHA